MLSFRQTFIINFLSGTATFVNLKNQALVMRQLWVIIGHGVIPFFS
jgi:hypothetical protein